MREEAQRGHKSAQRHHREQSKALGTGSVHLSPTRSARLPVSGSWAAAHSSGCRAHNPLQQPTPSDPGSAQHIHTPRPRTDKIRAPVEGSRHSWDATLLPNAEAALSGRRKNERERGSGAGVWEPRPVSPISLLEKWRRPACTANGGLQALHKRLHARLPQKRRDNHTS